MDNRILIALGAFSAILITAFFIALFVCFFCSVRSKRISKKLAIVTQEGTVLQEREVQLEKERAELKDEKSETLAKLYELDSERNEIVTLLQSELDVLRRAAAKEAEGIDGSSTKIFENILSKIKGKVLTLSDTADTTGLHKKLLEEAVSYVEAESKNRVVIQRDALDDLKQEKEDALQFITQKRGELEQAQSLLKEQESKATNLEQKVQAFTAAIQEYDNTISGLLEKKNAADTKITLLGVDLRKAQRVTETLQEERDALSETLNKQRTELLDASGDEKIKETIAQMSQEKQILEDKIRKLTATLENTYGVKGVKIARLETQNRELEVQLEDAERQRDDLQGKVTEMEYSIAELEKYKNSAVEKEGRTSEMVDAYTRLLNEDGEAKFTHEKEINALKEKIHSIQAEMALQKEQSSEEIKMLKEEKRKIKARGGQAEEAIQDMADVKRERGTLSEEVKALTLTIAEKEKVIVAKEEDKKVLQQEYDGLNEVLQKTREQIEKLTPKDKSEKEKKKGLKNPFRKKGKKPPSVTETPGDAQIPGSTPSTPRNTEISSSTPPPTHDTDPTADANPSPISSHPSTPALFRDPDVDLPSDINTAAANIPSHHSPSSRSTSTRSTVSSRGDASEQEEEEGAEYERI